MSTESALLTTPHQPHSETDGDIRVFRGRSIDELIPRIEAELGTDAIVVRRKRGLEGGIGGFFQRTFVEVEAKPGTPRIDIYDEGMGESAMPSPQQPIPAVPRPNGAYVTDTLATIAAAGTHESAPGTRESTPQPFPEPAVASIPRPSVQSTPEPAVMGIPRPSAQSTSEPVFKRAPELALQSTPKPVVENPPLPATNSAGAFQELTPDTFASALVEAEQALPESMPGAAHVPVATHTPVPTQDALGDELDLLDRDMGELQISRPQATPVPTVPQRGRARMGIERSMIGVGVSEELTTELIDAAIVHALPFAPRIGLAKAVHGAVVARIPRTPLLKARSATVAVIGPGGSGKTSCCAALLGAYRRAGALPASCATITLIGERDEPAMLLSPQIMEPEAIASMRAKQALAQAREEGLLLLDMPPLSPADRSTIRQMAGVLEALKPDRVVVALPATLGATAAAQLLEALRPLRATAMAITHADETDQIGVAIEAACQFGLAPDYLLDRSRVRGGLTRIDPTHLADRLFA